MVAIVNCAMVTVATLGTPGTTAAVDVEVMVKTAVSTASGRSSLMTVTGTVSDVWPVVNDRVPGRAL
jgi:hypothetical protein